MARDRLADEILALLQTAKRSHAAREALLTLFPKAGKLLNTPQSTIVDSGTSKRRISNGDFASGYFRLSPDVSVWSKSEADRLKLGKPSEAFAAYASKAVRIPAKTRSKLRRVLLDLLSEALREDQGEARGWFIAILDNTKLLLEDAEPRSWFGLSLQDHLRSLISGWMRPMEASTRAALVEAGIKEAADLSLLCDLFRGIAGDVVSGGIKLHQPDAMLGDRADELRQLLVARVRDLAAADLLMTQAYPTAILWFWWGSGLGHDVRTYMNAVVGNPDHAAAVMTLPISVILSTSGDYETVNRSDWEKIFDVEAVHKIAEELSKGSDLKLCDAASRFLLALARADIRDR